LQPKLVGDPSETLQPSCDSDLLVKSSFFGRQCCQTALLQIFKRSDNAATSDAPTGNVFASLPFRFFASLSFIPTFYLLSLNPRRSLNVGISEYLSLGCFTGLILFVQHCAFVDCQRIRRGVLTEKSRALTSIASQIRKNVVERRK